MEIEYTEDESRIRWKWHGEWHEADLEQLIMAYETEEYWGEHDTITMTQEDYDALVDKVLKAEEKQPRTVWSEEWTRQ